MALRCGLSAASGFAGARNSHPPHLLAGSKVRKRKIAVVYTSCPFVPLRDKETPSEWGFDCPEIAPRDGCVERLLDPDTHKNTQTRAAPSAQATDQVRLEGHGVTDPFTPSKEPKGDMWLPLAPTGRPKVFPTDGGGNTRSSDAGAAAAARLFAQQAMDEARLDRSGEIEEGATASRGGGRPRQDETCPSSSWCCICSEDATLRCRQCEADTGQDEPELFCSRCFRGGARGECREERLSRVAK